MSTWTLLPLEVRQNIIKALLAAWRATEDDDQINAPKLEVLAAVSIAFGHEDCLRALREARFFENEIINYATHLSLQFPFLYALEFDVTFSGVSATFAPVPMPQICHRRLRVDKVPILKSFAVYSTVTPKPIPSLEKLGKQLVD